MQRFFKMGKVARDFTKNAFGNILEWYDFTIYGLFAIQISRNFFPMHSKFLSLLLVFLTFAIGFVARPVGSIIFGMIGDKFGRHYAVNLSIWFMVIPTTLIGLLPTYYTIGTLAPLCLVLLRILQGISAGGQFSGLVTIAVDSSHDNKAFLVSLVHAISIVGCFIASFIGYLSISIISSLNSDNEIVRSLAWRIPFLISGILFLVYIKLRPKFHKLSLENSRKFSFMDILRNQPRELITMIILSSGTGTIYYILFTYFITYMQAHLNVPKITAFIIMNVILFSSVILYPIFGYLAKNYPCRVKQAQKFIVYLLVAIGVFSLSYVNVWFALLGLTFMVIYFCAITAFISSLFAEVFAPRYRMTACSLSYNIGVTVAGFAPLLAETSNEISIFGLPLFLAIVSIVMYLSLSSIYKSAGYREIIN